MSNVKIWIHAVWSTKKRTPILVQPYRAKISEHIYQNALDKGIMIENVGGYVDHVHCLFRLRNDQTVSKIMQLIKGEAAFWANKNLSLKKKLEWQSEYFAVSVSESVVPMVRKYIARQEEHHKKRSFQEEYDEFIDAYGFKVTKDSC